VRSFRCDLKIDTHLALGRGATKNLTLFVWYSPHVRRLTFLDCFYVFLEVIYSPTASTVTL
jgi:hypothetical protein